MDDDNIKRFQRKRDTGKKIRVLVRFNDSSIFEGFTYDLSLSGVFVTTSSDNILNKLSMGSTLHCFIEYDLDTMIEVLGEISRVVKEEDEHSIPGFAINFKSITEQNKLLLQNMVSSL